MAITMTVCNAVIDGNTFLTEGGSLIKLANVVAPSVGEPNFERAKEALEQLILDKLISFQVVSQPDSYIIANAWIDSLHINSYMQKLISGEA